MHLREQLTDKGQCSSFTNAEKGNVLSRAFPGCFALCRLIPASGWQLNYMLFPGTCINIPTALFLYVKTHVWNTFSFSNFSFLTENCPEVWWKGGNCQWAAVAKGREEDPCVQNLNKANFLDLYTLTYTLLSPLLMPLLESCLISHFAKISLSSGKLF